MQKTKRILSILLAVLLAFNVFTVAAGAAGGADYSQLDSYIRAYVPCNNDAGIYSAESYSAVVGVLNSIDRSLPDSQQSTVDGYLASLKTAVAGLVADESKAVADFTLQPSASVVHPGQIFSVDLNLSTNYGIAALGACVIYDSTMFEIYVNPAVSKPKINNYINITSGCMSGYTLTGSTAYTETLFSSKNSNAEYWSDSATLAQYKAFNIGLSYDSTKGEITVPNGKIATVQFKVVSDAAIGTSGNIFMNTDFNKTASFGAGVNYVSRAVGTALGAKVNQTCIAVGQTLNIDTTGCSVTAQHTPGAAATCTTDQICTFDGCGTVIAERLGHDFSVDTGVAQAATCSAAGIMNTKCSRCDATSTREIAIDPDNHNLGDWDVVTPAGCETPGLKTKTCSWCTQVIESEEIKATGHTEIEIPAVAATCTAAGSSAGVKCSVCQKVLVEPAEIPALGHEYSVDTGVAQAATCSATGIMNTKCVRCEDTSTREIAIDPNNHNYGSVVTGPTCTEDGFTTYTCSWCLDSYTADTVEATGHAWDEGTVIKEATYEETGILRYACTNPGCGETYEEEIPQLEPQSEPADYSAVTAAVKAAGKINPLLYSNASAVSEAVNAVVYDLTAEYQETVDGYAQAINSAIEGLVLIVDDITVVNGSIAQTNDKIYVTSGPNAVNVQISSKGKTSGADFDVNLTGTVLTKNSKGRVIFSPAKATFGEPVNGICKANQETTVTIDGREYTIVFTLLKSELKADYFVTQWVFRTEVDNENKVINVMSVEGISTVRIKGVTNFTLAIDKSDDSVSVFGTDPKSGQEKYEIARKGTGKEAQVYNVTVDGVDYTLNVLFPNAPLNPATYFTGVNGKVSMGKVTIDGKNEDAIVVLRTAETAAFGIRKVIRNSAIAQLDFTDADGNPLAGISEAKTSKYEYYKATPQDEEFSDIVAHVVLTLSSGRVYEYPLVFRFVSRDLTANVVTGQWFAQSLTQYDEENATMSVYGNVGYNVIRIRNTTTNGIPVYIDADQYSNITVLSNYYVIECPFTKQTTFKAVFDEDKEITMTVFFNKNEGAEPYRVIKGMFSTQRVILTDAGELQFQIAAGKSSLSVSEDLMFGQKMVIDLAEYGDFISYSNGAYKFSKAGVGRTFDFTVDGVICTATVTQATA